MNQDSVFNVDETEYQQGLEAAFFNYEPGELVGEPVGVHADFLFGWWVGIGEVTAWHEGLAAAEKGVMTCPYPVGSEQECFREPWISGYMARFDQESGRHD